MIKDAIRTIGRTMWLEDTLWLVLSGTGAEFAVTGTKAVIRLIADDKWNAGEENQPRVAVYMDGVRGFDVMLDEPEKTLTVFESESPETHVIRVVKLSEAPMSTCGVADIQVAGEITPTVPCDRLIEFVGDSITCGYGVEDEDRDHHFLTSTEDVTKAYAYKTANALGADYSMVSFSGYGIVSGYTGTGEKVGDQLVPEFYEKLGYSRGIYLGKYQPQDFVWDFNGLQPELIVINLGTNDMSYVLEDADRRAEYICGYVNFLKNIRSHNPEARILCVLGLMGTALCSAVEETVQRYENETGDGNIASMRFNDQLPEDGYAADWHPTERTHTKAALRLTEEIQKIMGW